MSGLTLPGVRVSPRDPTDGCTVQPDSAGSPSPGTGGWCWRRCQLHRATRDDGKTRLELHRATATGDAILGTSDGRRNTLQLPVPLQLAEWLQGIAQVAPCNPDAA